MYPEQTLDSLPDDNAYMAGVRTGVLNSRRGDRTTNNVAMPLAFWLSTALIELLTPRLELVNIPCGVIRWRGLPRRLSERA
jgi:hypothetical protein